MKRRFISALTALGVVISVFSVIPMARADDTPDPTYSVYITRDGTEYTAAVTLKNITATYGTFGLRYDTDLFTLAEVTQDEGSPPILYTPYTMYEMGADSGNYVFVWQQSDTDASEFDTTSGAKPVATFKFNLKEGANADDIAYNSITVIPWHDTGPAKAYAQTFPENNPDFEARTYYSEYWRYTDEKNETDRLEVGRLAAEKAFILGLGSRGFYQAAVNAKAGSEITDASYFFDVKTEIEYGFDVKHSILRFHVIDKQTGEDIEGATVTLYDTGGAKITDGYGNADYITDAHASETYTYTVTKDGYCPVPLSGALPSVTTTEQTSTEVTVELEKGYTLKGYVDLGQGTDISGKVQSGASVTFTRTDGMESAVQTTVSRNDAEFTAVLPEGTWTVTVTKAGYVKYIITDFVLSPKAGETIFGETDEGTRKITPYIGSARTGTSVTLLDAALIKAEMREGAVQNCGDVDDNGRVDVTDMAYVMSNYGRRTVIETYADFINNI